MLLIIVLLLKCQLWPSVRYKVDLKNKNRISIVIHDPFLLNAILSSVEYRQKVKGFPKYSNKQWQLLLHNSITVTCMLLRNKSLQVCNNQSIKFALHQLVSLLVKFLGCNFFNGYIRSFKNPLFLACIRIINLFKDLNNTFK